MPTSSTRPAIFVSSTNVDGQIGSGSSAFDAARAIHDERVQKVECFRRTIPAPGGSRRRIADSISHADVKRDGRLAYFRVEGAACPARDVVIRCERCARAREAAAGYHRYPRWSPDGRSLLAAVGEGGADVVLLDGLIDP